MVDHKLGAARVIGPLLQLGHSGGKFPKLRLECSDDLDDTRVGVYSRFCLGGRSPYEGAASLLADDQPLLTEDVQRVPDGHGRNPVPLGQLGVRVELLAGFERSGLDLPPKVIRHLHVGAAGVVWGYRHVSQVTQVIYRNLPPRSC